MSGSDRAPGAEARDRRRRDARQRPEDPDRITEHGVDPRDVSLVVLTHGHTAGSVSVLTDDGDLVAGDLVAHSFMGLIPGEPANPPFHDDPRRNLISLREMPDLNPGRFQVGHGAPLGPDRVRREVTPGSDPLSASQRAPRG
ncbi:MBL fold metallo-hydrolase [Streptomyces sp. NPDC099050]|uniref:MBL fold metallo-hydrolase n=1 Tax=Streptomyces sp. NPDC099050 TaxID=3366100 RepID=UPI003827FFE6